MVGEEGDEGGGDRREYGEEGNPDEDLLSSFWTGNSGGRVGAPDAEGP